jgi:hypothetical protein
MSAPTFRLLTVMLEVPPAAGLATTWLASTVPFCVKSIRMLLEAAGISRERVGHVMLRAALPVPEVLFPPPPPQPAIHREAIKIKTRRMAERRVGLIDCILALL